MLPFDHVRYKFLQMDETARESNPSFDQRELFGTCPAQLLLQRRRCRNVVADDDKDDGFLTNGGCRCRHNADAIIIIITRWDAIVAKMMVVVGVSSADTTIIVQSSKAFR